MANDFLYQIHRLNLNDQGFADFGAIAASFDTLKPSNYKDGSFRLRRYSRFDFDKHTQKLDLKANTAFSQDDSLNHFQGNVARTYEDLTADTYQSQSFVNLIDNFVTTTKLPDNCLIEVHQIRIIAKDGNTKAAAAPEGIHQDGFDYVGVVTINRQHVSDGELCLWHSPQDDKPIAKLNPEVGDICIVNDQKLWHSASDITIDGADMGYWDLFVFTAHHQIPVQ